MFGDGKIHKKAVGIAKNIVIQVAPSKRISIDALCYDVGDRYDLIIERECLHALQIGTDWSKHFWYIAMERGVVLLNVHYTKDHQRLHVDTDDDGDQEVESDVSYESEEEQYIDQDDCEEGYLLMEASDEEDDTYGPESPQEDRLSKFIDNIQIQDNIDLEDKKKLLQVIYRYKDCFGTSYDYLSTTNLVKFHVDTEGAKPIFKRPYASMSNSEKETLKKDLEEMVNNGILTPNTYVPGGNSKSSGWAFPVRYVPKKTGDRRLVTNFRPLNEVTIRDPWPMPNMVDVIESLAGSNWFVNADLLKAFQQIAVVDNLPASAAVFTLRCNPF
ncbi:hypothetical protein [Parasitella parasitica]|uniref:Reverse transcriptase domain-containing protein n=1 Tax=Parasitella parasitica TaxID=35722 RepID=A0A0B7NN09_9FUNG|nr:hypothetical protein [Parasitella parasitica]